MSLSQCLYSEETWGHGWKNCFPTPAQQKIQEKTLISHLSGRTLSTPPAAALVTWHGVKRSPCSYHWSKLKSWAFSERKPASEPCSPDYQDTFSLTSRLRRYHFQSETESSEVKIKLYLKESRQIGISAAQLFRSASLGRSSQLLPTHLALSSSRFSVAML